MPGGAAASVRLNRALARTVYHARGDGARIWDVDGNEYIDFSTSHGASILGHNHPRIREAIETALDMGIICSAETEYHLELARKISEMVPGAEMVRFSGSGSETIMYAVRLARAFTGRKKLIKFEGHFHGNYAAFTGARPRLWIWQDRMMRLSPTASARACWKARKISS